MMKACGGRGEGKGRGSHQCKAPRSGWTGAGDSVRDTGTRSL